MYCTIEYWMNTITVSELRSNLKDILEDVKKGKEYHITQRGKVIVSLVKADVNEDAAFQGRIAGYRKGGIAINGDIVNAPLKEFDYVDDSLYKPPSFKPSIAAEPDA